MATWVAHQQRAGLAAASVHKCHQVLSRVLAAAVRAGLLQRNVAENVELPRIRSQEMRFVTPGQITALADAHPQRHRAFVLIAAYGGFRFAELAGLRRHRVDLAGRVRVEETCVELKGTLHWGPPKTDAGPWRFHPSSFERYASTNGMVPARAERARVHRARGRPATPLELPAPPWRCGQPRVRTCWRSSGARVTNGPRSRWTATAICSRTRTRTWPGDSTSWAARTVGSARMTTSQISRPGQQHKPAGQMGGPCRSRTGNLRLAKTSSARFMTWANTRTAALSCGITSSPVRVGCRHFRVSCFQSASKRLLQDAARESRCAREGYTVDDCR